MEMNRENGIRIVVIDDDLIFVQGLQYLLEALHENIEYISSKNVEEALEVDENECVDLVILDYVFRNSLYQGMTALRSVAKYFNQSKIIVLSGADLDSDKFRDINKHDLKNAGATGFISKSRGQRELINALSTIINGNEYFPSSMRFSTQLTDDTEKGSKFSKSLTPRQMEIIGMVSIGYPNKEIANKLNLTEGTVKIHLHSVYRKLGVKNRTQAVQSVKQLAN